MGNGSYLTIRTIALADDGVTHAVRHSTATMGHTACGISMAFGNEYRDRFRAQTLPTEIMKVARGVSPEVTCMICVVAESGT